MAAVETFEKVLDIGGSQLFIKSIGEGTPTVVIDAGLGEGSASWAQVQKKVATLTRVCTYDRAGVGKSTPGPKPRTSQQMMTELHALLRSAQIEGPLVLVGHSLGGLNVQLYAALHPDQVAGMVLVDPSYAAMLPDVESVLGKIWMLLFNSQFASAAEGMTKGDFVTSCTQVVAAGKLPDVPLYVISAGQPVPLPSFLKAVFPNERLLRVLQKGHANLAQASNKGQQLIAEKSNHGTIQQDDLVIATIRRAVGAAEH